MCHSLFQTGLTFVNLTVVVTWRSVTLGRILVLIIIACLMPIKHCAKIENTQIRLLINDEDLLNEKLSDHEAASRSTTTLKENHEDHYNLYRSELKRLSYETIYRILRDENEPMYRPEDVEMRYYQKRSPSSSSSSPSSPPDCHHSQHHHHQHHHYDDEENHDLQKRSLKETTFLNLTKMNLKKFPPYPHVLRDYETLLSLDLSENYLETVKMEEFSRLQFLNLSHNRLTYLPLWQNSSLISLNLNYNRLKSFSLAYNVKLRELYLCCNEIASLASSNFTILYNLEVLDLSGNRLESLDSSLFPQMMHSLRVLNLADNQFVTVYRETFYNLLSLNTLLLAGNNISDIDYETFLALPNLQYLDLSYNQLQGKSIRALQGITGLVALSIAFNPHLGPYMQEFVASWSLKELDASGTGLCQIPAALALSVRSLGLTHNWLKIINCGDLDSYPLLQYLDLSFSRIEEIEDDALGRLEILEILMLDHNSLRKVPMSLPNSLEHLFLQHNDIMDLQLTSFQGLNNLQTLDLSYNKLLYLPALPLPKLQTLNLQSSDLRGINQAIVHTLPRLSDLMLEENPIKCSDLLGIAEWASSCRLTFKEEEQEFYDKTDAKETTTTATAMSSDLKRKFIKIHNFYEKFQEQQQKRGQQNKRNKSENLMEKTAEEEFTPFCAREVEREKSCHENEEKTANVKLNIKKEDISQEGLNSNTMAVKTTATPATATATKTITMFSTLAPTVAQRTLSSIEIKNNEAVVTDTAVQTTYSTKIEIRQSKRDQENENNIKNNNKNKMSSSNRNSNITTKTLRNSVTRKEATTVPEQQHSRQQEKITEIPILAVTRDQLDAAATAGAALTEDIPNTVRAERRANHNKTLTEKQMAAHLSELPTTTAATAIISAKKSAITISASPAPAPTQTKVINSLKFKTANKTTTFTIASTTTSASITRVPRTDMNFELKALNLTLGSTNIYNRNNPANTETNTHNVNMSISNENKNENHSNYNNSVNIVLASNMQALNNKDLISNSNSNSNSNNSNNNNNNNRKANGNSTTTNNSNNKIMIVTPSSSPSSSSSTSIASHETNTLPVKWNKTAITTTTTTMATTITNVEDMMIKYKKKHNSSDRAFVENDVNAVVKCMQSNSNDVGECISIESQQVKQQENEVKNEEKIGTLPTTTIARQAITTTSKPMTSTIQQQQQLQQHQQQQRHKHEPLQLQVRDRHLIGTPLLMHKGENLMVEADELILTKKKPMTKAPTIETKEITKYIKGNDAYADGRREQHHLNMFLDKSQLTKPLRDKEQSDSEMNLATVKTTIQAIKSNSTEVTINKAKKPSLMMKKMTIITKQHESQPHTFLTNEDNEVIAKTFDNMNFQELRPKETKESHGHKHSTVNTPLYQIGAKAIHEPHTFQHEHDMIMKQLLQHQQQQHQQQHQQQQRQQQDVKISKTEHWLDIRKSDKRNSHSGLVLLMSLGLFVVLLLGLMHVYRCDIPWRRHISATSATAQLRPHQRHNSSMEDDSHSFLSYQEGVQKWHHSTRQQPPYSSPLHNLHVRELQKTSATEVIPIVRTSATTNISTKSQQHWNNSTLTTRNSRCSVNSQSTSSSTASSISASSSAILDDESFYIEMTPDSGQIACALNSELLPMELLNLAKQKQSRRDLTINSITQTSMGDDHTAPPQQQQQQQQQLQQRIMHTQTVKTLSSTSSSSPAAPSIVVADTKQLAPSARKFSLW